VDSVKKSTRLDFEVIDPFDPPGASKTEIIATYVWQKVEDCFDAEDEGPWLRDMTLNYFNERKMGEFIAEGLFEINERQPRPSSHRLLLHRRPVTPRRPTCPCSPPGLHGRRPSPHALLRRAACSVMGAAGRLRDRRDYLQRWQTVYEIEMKAYEPNVTYFKRRFLGLGHSKHAWWIPRRGACSPPRCV
jgi:hypothetical protein